MRTVIVAAMLVSAAALSGRAQGPVFESASTDLVVLPVTVFDRDGHLVASLTRDDFLVFDNGRRQEIALFNSEDTPVTVGLVIDDSRSMTTKMPGVIAAAATFARSSNPQDELFAIAFNDTVVNAIPGRPLAAADVPALQRRLEALVPDGRTALYDATLAGIERVRAGTSPRKVLIVLSDGGDNASAARLKDVLARARQADVTIYTIGLFDETDFDRNPGVLKALAHETGGSAFMPETPSGLLRVCRRIAHEIRSGYTLAFAPPDHDGAYHKVTVHVRAPEGERYIARTRPGYVAPPPALAEHEDGGA